MDLTVEDLAKMIDHTRLKPETKHAKIQQLCEEAVTYGFVAVCINPVHVAYASELLKDTDVKVCSVIGFPLGASLSVIKAAEAKEAVKSGAHEIDMVVNVGALRDENHNLVRSDIEAVVAASGDAHVKVILETGLLTDDQKRQGCLLSKEAGAHFVKTSTGFGPGGATVEDVALMRRDVGPNMGIKAAGGIRTLETAKAIIEAGATCIGASAGVKIVQEAGTG